MTYSRRLKLRRHALRLSQRELAERSGVKQPLISALESGRREPTAATSEALDKVLTVRPSVVLASLREEARAVVARHHGNDPRVFGSVARGTDGPESDIDILVTFGVEAGITDLLALEEDLADLLTVPVDVVSAGSSGRVVQRALAEAVPL